MINQTDIYGLRRRWHYDNRHWKLFLISGNRRDGAGCSGGRPKPLRHMAVTPLCRVAFLHCRRFPRCARSAWHCGRCRFCPGRSDRSAVGFYPRPDIDPSGPLAGVLSLTMVLSLLHPRRGQRLDHRRHQHRQPLRLCLGCCSA